MYLLVVCSGGAYLQKATAAWCPVISSQRQVWTRLTGTPGGVGVFSRGQEGRREWVGLTIFAPSMPLDWSLFARAPYLPAEAFGRAPFGVICRGIGRGGSCGVVNCMWIEAGLLRLMPNPRNV